MRSLIITLLAFFAGQACADNYVHETQFAGSRLAAPAATSAQPIVGIISAPPTPLPQAPQNNDNSQALQALTNMLSKMGGGGGGKAAKIPKDADHQTNPNASEGPSGATASPTDMQAPAAGQCGSAQDLWQAAANVTKENVIPAGSGYNMSARGWPKLVKNGDRYEVSFAPGKQSMCTSATAAAFYQHLADLGNRGELELGSQELNFLNTSRVAHNAFNGNTYSVALFYSYLGGQSIIGTRGAGDIRSKLAQAKPGDVLKFDRSNGTGHSTIFKDIEGDKFCYWSSNTRTKGPGVQCESMSSLVDVSVSRFPADPDKIPGRLDAMASSGKLKSLLSSGNGTIPAAQAGFVNTLECKSSGTSTQTSDAAGTARK